jgi:hypothetical protein
MINPNDLNQFGPVVLTDVLIAGDHAGPQGALRRG